MASHRTHPEYRTKSSLLTPQTKGCLSVTVTNSIFIKAGTMNSTSSLHLMLLVLLLSLQLERVKSYSPWNFNHPRKISRRTRGPGRRERWTMYKPPSGPTSETAPMVAQKMLKSMGGSASASSSERSSSLRLSSSFLASTSSNNENPSSFRTANGILSPETVSRMDTLTNGGANNRAVQTFLRSYSQKGPMSCLEMLSDPEILPHLTQAMRDII